ncbi:hypothetical protein LL240_00720 [Oceanimonas baumannii]|uniref:phage integrase n=1 Tax=Oceanimonas baumannii TaxID=129578 RepID=UPI001D18C1C6|nr:hypothetical protein [Oceanimonas baumannii]MCC4262981.1 hypothetical protein [Oceanimonas baumannii]
MPWDGRRIRRLFTIKGEAMAFERHLLSSDKPWQNEAEEQEERRLSDLVDRWYGLHGQSLTDGTSRLSKLNHLVNALGDPVATEFTAKDFASYRERRLAGDETTRPVTPNGEPGARLPAGGVQRAEAAGGVGRRQPAGRHSHL